MKIMTFVKYLLCCKCRNDKQPKCDENDGIPCECHTKAVSVVDGMVEIALE